MSNAQTLSWLLTADDRASGAFKNVAASMSTMSDRATLARTALTALGATAAVGYLTVLTKQTIDLADSLDDLSQFTGISAHGLSTLKYAVDTTGPGFDVLTKGIQTMYKAMGDAASGNLELVSAFAAVGVSLDDIKNKKSDEVLMLVSDGLAAMPASAQKADLAMKLFRGSAEQLVPWLNQGSAAIADLRTEAEKAGLAISNEFAAKAGELNDNLAKLKAQVNVLGIDIGTVLVPRVNDVVSAFNRARQSGDDWLHSLSSGLQALASGGQAAGLKAEIADIKETIAQANSEDMGFMEFYARNLDAIGSSPEAYMAELQKRLKAKQAALAELGKQPPPPPPNTDGSNTNTPSFYNAAASAKADPYEGGRARDASALKGEQAAYDARKELLRQYLDAGTMSYADYYSGMAATEDAYYAASHRKIEAELGRQREIAKNGDASERSKAMAKQTELLADLDVLKVKQHSASLARDAEEAKSREALNKQLQQYYVQFLEQSGQEVKAAELKAAAQFAEIERMAKINGLSTEYVDKLKAIAVETAKYDKAVRDLGTAQKEQGLKELKAQNQLRSGQLSSYGLEKRLVEIRKEGARALLAQAQAALKLAETSGDADKILDAKTRVEEIRGTIDELDGMQRAFWNSLEGHTQSALEGILNGTTSIMDGVKGVFTGVMQDINREVSKELTEIVMNFAKTNLPSLMGGASGGSGAGGGGWMGTAVSVISSLFGARAAGGSAGGLTMVGERGIELLDLPHGSYVHNNARTQQMLSQPGRLAGPQIVFNVSTPDAASFRRSEGQIQTMLTAATRRGTRNA